MAWDKDPQNPDRFFGALLVDTKTEFQNLGRLPALLAVHYIWPRAFVDMSSTSTINNPSAL